jgi:hypothetical protein
MAGTDGRALTVRLGAGTVLVASGLALAAAGLTTASPDGRSAVAAPSADAFVYRVSVDAPGTEGVPTRIEWVAPLSGSWRVDGDHATKIYADGRYVVVDPDQGAFVRSGSRWFLGDLPDRAVARDALRSHVLGTAGRDGVSTRRTAGRTELAFSRRGMRFRATVLERVAANTARARALFTVPNELVTSFSAERSPGSRATIPVVPYWFGSGVAGRRAVGSIEHSSKPIRGNAERVANPRGEAVLYITFYELPEAGDLSGATPGQDTTPEGEIQVVSQPRSLARARGMLEAADGVNGDLRYEPWPRDQVELANGERAQFVINRGEPPAPGPDGELVWREFWVVTDSTLTAVIGSFTEAEARALAERLMPVG